MARGGRGQRRAAQSAQLQLWAAPMVLSLFLVVCVLLLTILCVSSTGLVVHSISFRKFAVRLIFSILRFYVTFYDVSPPAGRPITFRVTFLRCNTLRYVTLRFFSAVTL